MEHFKRLSVGLLVLTIPPALPFIPDLVFAVILSCILVGFIIGGAYFIGTIILS